MTLRAIPARVCTLSMGFLLAGTFLTLAATRSSEDLALDPRAGLQDRPVRLRRGEPLLVEVLQQLADYTGNRVLVPGGEPPGRTVVVSRDRAAVDLDAARQILRDNGLDVRSETQGGSTVLRVERTFLPPTGQGRIIRKSDPEGSTEPESDAGTPSVGAQGAPTARRSTTGSVARLYAGEEGTSPRYMVVFETDSRKEAENALLVLRALREPK